MTRELFFHGTEKARRRRTSFSLKVSFSYIVFLLLCLVLAVVLYTSSTQSARDNYWQGRMTELERAVSAMEDDLSAMDSYTRQLLIDSTFIRFAGMKGMEEKGYIYTAYEVMQTLSSRLYSISSLPVKESRIYLKNSGYVISASQFTEVQDFYDDWRIYHPGGFEAWLDMVLSAVGGGSFMDISSFTSSPESYVFIRDINAIMNRNVPAVIWFEMDMDKLRSRFLPADAQGESLLCLTDASGQRQMTLSGSAAQPQWAQHMEAVAFDQRGFALADGMVYLRCEGAGKTGIHPLPAAGALHAGAGQL